MHRQDPQSYYSNVEGAFNFKIFYEAKLLDARDIYCFEIATK